MKINSLPAALVLITALACGATLVALGKPDVAAFLSLVGVVVQALLPSVVRSSSSSEDEKKSFDPPKVA